MQDIPAIDSTKTDQTNLLTSPTWESSSADDAVFSGFLAYESAKVQQSTPAPESTQESAYDHKDAQHEVSVEIKNRSEEIEDRYEDVGTSQEAASETAESQDVKDIVDGDDNLQDMKDVAVDLESFQAMRSQLQKYGLSDDDIATLERKVTSEKGMTWGELVTFISKNMETGSKSVELTSGQQQKLMTFFQKLGFSAPESERMISDLADGNAKQISDTVMERLTTLPQDKLAGLNKEELDAFNELMDKFQKEAKSDERGLIRVVGKAMENAMDKARRMAQEHVDSKQIEAGKGDGNAVKTLAETASRSTDVDTSVDKAAVFTDDSPAADQAKQQAKDADKLMKALSPEEQLKANMNKTGESVAKGTELSQHKNADSFLQQDSGTDDKAWNEFFEKLKLEETVQGRTLTTETAKGFAENLNQAKNSASQSAKSWTQTEAPKVIKQVENAVLKNLTGGGKRLTLQLTPESLGTVNIALTVKNSEVSATIRADNAEAGKLIADQLETIRQSLEEQGLKVSKLEVQTQLSGGDSGTWQEMAGQGKEFQNGMWSRMRSGMNGNGGGEYTMQEMSEMAREAILSQNGNGLHVVA